MSQVFVSFKFFLRKEPCATARCGSITTNPRFEQTIALKQALRRALRVRRAPRALGEISRARVRRGRR